MLGNSPPAYSGALGTRYNSHLTQGVSLGRFTVALSVKRPRPSMHWRSRLSSHAAWPLSVSQRAPKTPNSPTKRFGFGGWMGVSVNSEIAKSKHSRRTIWVRAPLDLLWPTEGVSVRIWKQVSLSVFWVEWKIPGWLRRVMIERTRRGHAGQQIRFGILSWVEYPGDWEE